MVEFRGPKPDYTGLPFVPVPVKKGDDLCVVLAEKWQTSKYF